MVQAAIMAVAVIVFFATRPPPPKQDIADGVYRNNCCADIVIEKGRLSQHGVSLPIKLLNMKFGVTGYVKGCFTKKGVRASVDETPIPLFAKDGHRALTILIEGREYTFNNVKSGEAK